jgi:ABC-2 type transport system permease protein
MSVPPGIATSVLKLLRLRLSILINSIRRAKRRTKIVYAIIGVSVLIFLGMSLGISIALLGFIHSPEFAEHIRNGKQFLDSFPAIVMSISGCGILLTSFSVLLQALYLSDDMDFLMSTPTPIRAVFIAKLVQGVFPNFIILCLLTIPVLFGLGISSGYHALYYLFLIMMLATIAFSAASLASLLVMIAVRFFSPRRMAEVLGFFIGLTVFIASQMAPRLMNQDFNSAGYRQISAVLNTLQRFNSLWSPLAWAGRGLINLGRSAWIPALCWISAFFLITGIIVYAALVTSERLYYSGWANLQNNRGKIKKQVKSKAAKGTAPLFRMLPSPIRAILIKDLRLYRRDLHNLSGLLFPIILGVVYALGLVRSHWQMPPGRGHAPPGIIQMGNAMFGYADIAPAIFLGWMLIGNLAGLAFSREGKNYWMLKAAPINTRQLLAAKFLVSFIPSALLCSIYLLILEILKGVALWSILINAVVVCLIVAATTGIYLAIGTRGAKFDWENPAQVYQTVGCVGMLISMLFLPICFGLFIGPAIVAEIFHSSVIAGRLTGLLLGGIVCALAAFLPLALVEKRVSFLAETD